MCTRKFDNSLNGCFLAVENTSSSGIKVLGWRSFCGRGLVWHIVMLK